MRIETVRKLLWGANVLLLVACAAGLGAVLSLGGPWDRAEDGPPRRKLSEDEVRDSAPRSDLERLVRFPMDGPRPPTAPPGEPGEAVAPAGSLASFAELVSYRRFIPSTDEARVTLRRRGGGEPVTLGIGEAIPGTRWILLDVLEGRAVFQRTDTEVVEQEELRFQSAEVVTAQGVVAAGEAEPPPAARTSPGKPGKSGAPDVKEVRSGVFEYGADEEACLADEARAEEVRESVRVSPWANPESGKYEGIVIRRLDAGSHLAALGWRKGDILLSLDGQPMRGRDDIVLHLRGPGKDLRQHVAEILRDGEPRTLTYDRRR